MVTSGPTVEPIDPVRVIANRSSGKQGHAIAAAAARAGADVVLVSGPGRAAGPRRASSSGGSRQRARCCGRSRRHCRPTSSSAPPRSPTGASPTWPPAKLKKGAGGPPTLALCENPDILAHVATHPTHRPGLVIGFAAETDDLLAHAAAKLRRKGCDVIVANDVSPAAGTFGGDANAVTIVEASGATPWPPLAKAEVAARLIRLAAERLAPRPGTDRW